MYISAYSTLLPSVKWWKASREIEWPKHKSLRFDEHNLCLEATNFCTTTEGKRFKRKLQRQQWRQVFLCRRIECHSFDDMIGLLSFLSRMPTSQIVRNGPLLGLEKKSGEPTVNVASPQSKCQRLYCEVCKRKEWNSRKKNETHNWQFEFES